MEAQQALLKTAIDAAHSAGDVLRDLIEKPRQIREKGYLDIVTDADLAADQAIQAIIKRDGADHVILSEESEQAAGYATWQPPSGYWWVIDPIDGTTNFARGVPSWSISIAAGYGADLQAAVVYDVLHDHLFAAARGHGATFNGTPITTNQQAALEWAICINDWAVSVEARQQSIQIASALLPKIRSLRCWGTTALGLAHVAAGYVDAYFHAALKPWDAAAGVLLVQEAGGMTTRFDGTTWNLRSGDLLASNRPLHSTLIDLFDAALR